jgi:Transposase DDE domain
MLTCKSPRKVMLVAHHLAVQVLPAYSCKFSRRDFTLPQLFACLVVREHQRQSYRGCEALLRDADHWCRAIGMRRVPDHNTLCRAFTVIVTGRLMGKALDVLARWFSMAGVLRLSLRPLTLDTSYFESRHVSRHYERRRGQTGAAKGNRGRRPPRCGRGRPDAAGSRTRRRSTKKLPKAGFAVASACHAILAAKAATGAGADQRWLEPLLYGAWRRVPHRRFAVVADCGFDSEDNHQIARRDMRLRTLIPPGAGRKPKHQATPPGGKWRRHMKRLLRTKRGRRRCGYTQRWQSETANSMIKRNLGSALRARTPKRREREMLLRAVVHNVMLAPRHRGSKGRDGAVSTYFPLRPIAKLMLTHAATNRRLTAG